MASIGANCKDNGFKSFYQPTLFHFNIVASKKSQHNTIISTTVDSEPEEKKIKLNVQLLPPPSSLERQCPQRKKKRQSLRPHLVQPSLMVFNVKQIKPNFEHYVQRYPYLFSHVHSINPYWFDNILSPVFDVARRIYGPAPAEPSHAERIIDGAHYQLLNRRYRPDPTIVKRRVQYNLLDQLDKSLATTLDYNITNIWAFTRHVPLDSVKAIVFGSEPNYKTSDGMAYSASKGTTPSLKYIFEAIRHQMNGVVELNDHNGDLKRWAQQGVLLINIVLTASRSNKSMSHARFGWIELTSMIIFAVCLRARVMFRRPLFAFVWGRLAQRFVRGPAVLHDTDFERLRALLLETWRVRDTGTDNEDVNVVIDDEYHVVKQSVHPSPIAASPSIFRDNNHFAVCNEMLIKHGVEPINWQ